MENPFVTTDWLAARLADWQISYLPIDSVIHEQKEEGYHETGFVAWLLKRNSVYYLMKIGRRAEAWGYASLSLSLFVFKLFFKSPRREYADFIQQLMTGYFSVLSGNAAGRPFARQSILKQAARS